MYSLLWPVVPAQLARQATNLFRFLVPSALSSIRCPFPIKLFRFRRLSELSHSYTITQSYIIVLLISRKLFISPMENTEVGNHHKTLLVHLGL